MRYMGRYPVLRPSCLGLLWPLQPGEQLRATENAVLEFLARVRRPSVTSIALTHNLLCSGFFRSIQDTTQACFISALGKPCPRPCHINLPTPPQVLLHFKFSLKKRKKFFLNFDIMAVRPSSNLLSTQSLSKISATNSFGKRLRPADLEVS